MFSYSVKVRGNVFLWGSSGVLKELAWPLLLVVGNDFQGDPIDLVAEDLTSADVLGTLGPGEFWTVPLLGLRGVHATCAADSLVTCSIIMPHLGEPT